MDVVNSVEKWVLYRAYNVKQPLRTKTEFIIYLDLVTAIILIEV